MVQLTDRFSVFEAEVASKIIDNEVVLINISTGVFYTLDALGVQAFEMLRASYSVHEMAEVFASVYGVNMDQAEADVAALVESLLSQGLVQPSTAPKGTVAVTALGAYSAPKLISYNDLRDLLALDPPMPIADKAPWQK